MKIRYLPIIKRFELWFDNQKLIVKRAKIFKWGVHLLGDISLIIGHPEKWFTI